MESTINIENISSSNTIETHKKLGRPRIYNTIDDLYAKRREYARKYFQEHKDKYAQANREYYARNTERVKKSVMNRVVDVYCDACNCTVKSTYLKQHQATPKHTKNSAK